jgi:hypothetical protein
MCNINPGLTDMDCECYKANGQLVLAFYQLSKLILQLIMISAA